MSRLTPLSPICADSTFLKSVTSVVFGGAASQRARAGAQHPSSAVSGHLRAQQLTASPAGKPGGHLLLLLLLLFGRGGVPLWSRFLAEISLLTFTTAFRRVSLQFSGSEGSSFSDSESNRRPPEKWTTAQVRAHLPQHLLHYRITVKPLPEDVTLMFYC